MLKLLLDHGADPNAKNNVNTIYPTVTVTTIFGEPNLAHSVLCIQSVMF